CYSEIYIGDCKGDLHISDNTFVGIDVGASGPSIQIRCDGEADGVPLKMERAAIWNNQSENKDMFLRLRGRAAVVSIKNNLHVGTSEVGDRFIFIDQPSDADIRIEFCEIEGNTSITNELGTGGTLRIVN